MADKSAAALLSERWRERFFRSEAESESEKKGRKWVRNRKFSGIFRNSVRKAQPRYEHEGVDSPGDYGNEGQHVNQGPDAATGENEDNDINEDDESFVHVDSNAH